MHQFHEFNNLPYFGTYCTIGTNVTNQIEVCMGFYTVLGETTRNPTKATRLKRAVAVVARCMSCLVSRSISNFRVVYALERRQLNIKAYNGLVLNNIFKIPFTPALKFFSSPEPKAHRGGYSIPMLRRPSVRRHPPFSKIFSSETAWPTKAKFYIKHLWEGGTSVYIRNPGHMTKMAAMPIYGKNL